MKLGILTMNQRWLRRSGQCLLAMVTIAPVTACRKTGGQASFSPGPVAPPESRAATVEAASPADDGSDLATSAWVTPDLTPLQHHVTKENGTERAFSNEYWDNKADGIPVSILTGKPLLSSLDKYDSGCGWPSFVKPISDGEIRNLPDHSHGMSRTEVRTADDASHLGHVFEDGPPERGGLRYCINSAALRFIPRERMAAAGYGHLLAPFEASATEENQKPTP